MLKRSILGGFWLWAIWIAVSLLGAAVTFALWGILGIFGTLYHFLGGGRIDLLPSAFISGLIDGALSGSFQWVVLRKRLPQAGRWIAATCIGITLGWCAVIFIPATDWSIPRDDFAWFIYIVAVSRIAAALLQWWLVRKERGSYWWIVASIAGWVCADLVTVALARDSGLGPWAYVLMSVVAGSMISAIGALWLMDHSEQRGSRVLGVGIATSVLLLAGWLGVEIRFSQQIRSLRGHSDSVLGVAFSPDGKTLASASADGSVILWDVANGNLIRTVPVNQPDAQSTMSSINDVERVLFSPDGSILATVSSDGSFELWDATSGDPLFSERAMSRGVPCIAFSTDSRMVAVQGDTPAAHISLWDIPSEEVVQEVPLHEGAFANVMGFSEENQVMWLASVLEPWPWEMGASPPLVTHRGSWQDPGCSHHSALSQDGKYVATGGGKTFTINERAVIFWDLENKVILHTLAGPGVTAIALSPDDRVLAIGRNHQHPLLLWDVVKWEEISQLRGGNNISAIAFSPDGKLLATGSLDGLVRFWKVPKVP